MLNQHLKFIIPLAMLLSACASLPPPPVPVHKNASVLGLRLNIRASMMGSHTPVKVYFVRADNPKQHPKKGTVIAANYKDGDIFYLLNAEPGYYMLTFCRLVVSKNRYTALFPEKVALASRTRVKSGELVFMGDINIKTTRRPEQSDSYQKYLVASLEIENKSVADAIQKSLNPFAQKVKHIFWYGMSHSTMKDPEAKKAFLTDSMEAFKNTAWSSKF